MAAATTARQGPNPPQQQHSLLASDPADVKRFLENGAAALTDASVAPGKARVEEATPSSLSPNTTSDLITLHRRIARQRISDAAQLDAHMLAAAPSYLDMHNHLVASHQSLSTLSTFLDTFRSDLASLSSQIQRLRDTSSNLDSRLRTRRQLEARLSVLLQAITLSPRLVQILFDTEPDPGWKDLLRIVHDVLAETQRLLDTKRIVVPGGTASGTSSGAADEIVALGPDELGAVRQARQVAESCRVMAATKLKPYLLAPFATIRASLTTNLQVLQTSILLRHHAPLYAFLAHHAPEVARDVQRGYMASVRLYFETGFRRYARSLGVARDRARRAGGASAPAAASALGPSGGLLAGAAAAVTTTATAATSSSSSSASASSAAGPWHLITDIGRKQAEAAKALLARASASGASLSSSVGDDSTITNGGVTAGGGGARSTLASLLNPDSNMTGGVGGWGGSASGSGGGGGGGGGAAAAIKVASEDPWIGGACLERLSHGSIDDGPAVVLAYQAEDPKNRIPIEALFRSLSLAFLDNATSEWVFLVRYFEFLGTASPLAASAAMAASGAGEGAAARGGKIDAGAGGASQVLSSLSSLVSGSQRTPTTAVSAQRRSGVRGHEEAMARGDARTRRGQGGSAQGIEEAREEDDDDDDGEGPGPEESASVAGVELDESEADGRSTRSGLRHSGTAPRGGAEGGDEEEEEGETRRRLELAEQSDQGSVVRLSLREQRALDALPVPLPAASAGSVKKARRTTGTAVAEEMWRTVMEPVIDHWKKFSRSLLSASPPASPLALLTMLRLLERLQSAAEERGASALLTPLVQELRLEAYPTLQRGFNEQIEAVRKLAGGVGGGGHAGASGAASTTTAGSGGLMSGFGSLVSSVASVATGATSASASSLSDEAMVCLYLRYALLYSGVVRLSGDSADDGMLFSNLHRLRNELERLLAARTAPMVKQAGGAARASAMAAQAYDAVLRGLELGAAPLSQARCQAELSHWTELKRAGRLTQ